MEAASAANRSIALAVGVDKDAHVDSPSSLSGREAELAGHSPSASAPPLRQPIFCLPFGKFFHIFQRPAQVVVKLYHHAGGEGLGAMCARV